MIKHVLFDLDGTLTDPGEGITNSVAYALERYGIKLLDPGNPFDFLILYSLKASYGGEDEFMSERIENVLGMMFPDD